MCSRKRSCTVVLFSVFVEVIFCGKNIAVKKDQDVVGTESDKQDSANRVDVFDLSQGQNPGLPETSLLPPFF